MENNPLVSIIVPIYNTSKYLHKCIDSIINQSYKNIEIILVDDGSTDKSSEIIDEYHKKDSRIIAIHQKNSGQSNARNTGIKISNGDFISFVDSDDEIDKDFVFELLNRMNDDVDLSVCGMKYKKIKIKKTLNVYINKLRPQKNNESIITYMLYLLAVDGRMYSSVNKLYVADIIRKNNLFFSENINFAEDTRFVLDYIKYMSGKINFVLKPLYIYNFGTDTSTISETGVNWKNWKTFYTDLNKWADPKNSIKKFWLNAIYLRWKISFIRTKKRSK